MHTSLIRIALTLLLLGLASSLGVSQQSTPPIAPPASPPGGDAALNQLLSQWERDMGGLQTLVIEFNCTRTYASTRTKDDPEGIKKYFLGSLRCMRLPDGSFGAVVQLATVPAGKGDASRVVEKYVCTGTHIYNISPDTKTMDIHTLPPRQPGQPLDDGPMPFLTGMKAEVARKRYQLAARDPTDEKVKPWYTYVEVTPNFPRDQQDFVKARLVIMKRDLTERDTGRLLIPTGMPRELFWIEPTNNTTKWEIVRVLRNVPNSVDRREFMKPEVPADWKVQNVSSTAPARPPSGSGEPRVIRNQDR